MRGDVIVKKELSFAICAYKRSEYLEELVLCLKHQSIPVEIYISTSTPNEHIESIANKYKLPVYVNDTEKKGSPADWNFAYAQAKTPYVVLAHQDDRYEKDYAERILHAFHQANHPIIAFSDYYEIRDGKKVYDYPLRKIKDFMLKPLKFSHKSRFIRNRILSIGFPICCPAIAYCKENYPSIDFKDGWVNSHDWEAIARLAKQKGEFQYISKPLVGHRIYEESQTTNTIASGARSKEDYEVLRSYWPAPIAKLILKYYSKSMESNSL